jgi:2-amino-4-hydroxy-6-hydroxymethyldihydropteridine diphosphokinase
MSPPTQLTDCLIGLGSNLGDRQRALDDAITSLRQKSQLTVAKVSRWYGTPAIGGPAGQGAFLNGAALVRTTASPTQLLWSLHDVESRAGRTRSQRWAPRRLDLDLLLHGSRVERSPTGALVPHPWMAIRPFVLRPALEVAPQMIHPQLEKTIAELWQLAVRPTTIVVVLQSLSTDTLAVTVTAATLQRCAERANAGFISLLPHVEVGLPSARRIQSMVATAELMVGTVEETSARRAIIVHGWWDQVMLEPEVPTELVEKRSHLASTIPVPNVTIGLLPHSAGGDQPEAATGEGFEMRFDRYLAGLVPPRRPPFLKISDDPNQIAHDVTAILRGFAEIDLRPAG